MKYHYKIILDPKKDAYNWHDGCNSEGFGVDWKTRVSADLYKNINGKPRKEALKFILPFLKQKYIDEKAAIDKHITLLEKSFDEKFNDACLKIVELTGKELYLNEFTFFITTFPRGPYNFGKGYIWDYIGWNDPVAGFMHELLHFQFHHYWRDDKDSPVSKLTEDQFQYLKESLTVILDKSLVPPMERPDAGYEIHQEYRIELHKFWTKNRNFDELVDFGLKVLPDFIR